ncbi:hypothetical protein D9M69_584460 [compost metagenome]
MYSKKASPQKSWALRKVTEPSAFSVAVPLTLLETATICRNSVPSLASLRVSRSAAITRSMSSSAKRMTSSTALKRPTRVSVSMSSRSQTVPSAKTISSSPVSRPRKWPLTSAVSIKIPSSCSSSTSRLSPWRTRLISARRTSASKTSRSTSAAWPFSAIVSAPESYPKR